MAKSNTRLELTWIGKENRPKLEPRILIEDPDKSYHAAHRASESDLFDNRLIFGDNLLALKTLEQEFTGKIKCIYIDPPYKPGWFGHQRPPSGNKHFRCALPSRYHRRLVIIKPFVKIPNILVGTENSPHRY